MELALQPAEVALLRRILTNYLSDLRMEIADTERYDLRQELKRDEEMIKRLLARLAQLAAEPAVEQPAS
jgi:ABC-type anion transport system duplicated permease subunit